MTILVMMLLNSNFIPMLTNVPTKVAIPDRVASVCVLPAIISPIIAPAIVPSIIPTGVKKNPIIMPIKLPIMPCLVAPYFLAVHMGTK